MMLAQINCQGYQHHASSKFLSFMSCHSTVLPWAPVNMSLAAAGQAIMINTDDLIAGGPTNKNAVSVLVCRVSPVSTGKFI